MPTKPRLTIELVPSPLWGKSLASQMPRRQWDVIRRSVYARAGGYCEICHNQSQRLLCHEVWDYDDERRVARLAELVAICPACNLSTHIGRAQRVGLWDEARNHLLEVNGWTVQETLEYIDDAFAAFHVRSQYSWTLDTSELPRLVSWLGCEAQEAAAAAVAG